MQFRTIDGLSVRFTESAPGSPGVRTIGAWRTCRESGSDTDDHSLTSAYTFRGTLVAAEIAGHRHRGSTRPESDWPDLPNTAWLARRFTPQGRPEPTMQRHAKSVASNWQAGSSSRSRPHSDEMSGPRETPKRADRRVFTAGINGSVARSLNADMPVRYGIHTFNHSGGFGQPPAEGDHHGREGGRVSVVAKLGADLGDVEVV